MVAVWLKMITFDRFFKEYDKIEEEALNIFAKEGTIYCDEEFTIYNLAGLNVTSLNGTLQGVYLVVTTNGNKQVSVW